MAVKKKAKKARKKVSGPKKKTVSTQKSRFKTVVNPPATSDVRVASFTTLASPAAIKKAVPASKAILDSVLQGRKEIRAALEGKDKRFLVILGPCSIHDEKAAYEYAEKLAPVRDKVRSTLLIIMRVYFEKPRTTIGWKGLINDPWLDSSYDISNGLKKARQVLNRISSMGHYCATEFLDPIVPQYTADLVAWAAIGARTTESQTHREMASGLSMPVGFKNATDGGLQVAIDAMASAKHSHAFLGIDQNGGTSIVRTKGNIDTHIVLRGGSKPNYSVADVAYAKALCELRGDRRGLMVDCSHGNSNKDYRKQPMVFDAVLQQFIDGEKSLLGCMLESHLVDGTQKLINPKELLYGQSITDGCLGWETTERLLLTAHERLRGAI